MAASQIDMVSGQVEEKQAFYGDIDNMSYGEGWLTFVTIVHQADEITRSAVYTFDTEEGFSYTGKISTASVLGQEDAARIKDGALTDGGYPEIVSVTRYEQEYRIAGTYNERKGRNNSLSILLISADMTAGDINYRLQPMEENNLEADHVAGIDTMYWHGSPYGHLESLIPMGNGICLRYNAQPDGLHIYDFSDSADPELLYDSPGEVPEGCRLEFENEVYDENTFGIKAVWPDENGEYRNVTYMWRIYQVDVTAEFLIIKDIIPALTLLANYSI